MLAPSSLFAHNEVAANCAMDAINCSIAIVTLPLKSSGRLVAWSRALRLLGEDILPTQGVRSR